MAYHVYGISINGYPSKDAQQLAKYIWDRFARQPDLHLVNKNVDRILKINPTPTFFVMDAHIVRRKQIYIYSQKEANRDLASIAVAAMMDKDYKPIGLDVFVLYRAKESFEVASHFSSQV